MQGQVSILDGESRHLVQQCQQALFQGGSLPVDRPELGPFDISSNRSYVIMMAVLFCAVAMGVVWLRRGPFGRRLLAMKDSPAACATLGLNLTVLLHIRMDKHTPERFEQFEAVARRYPEVQECYLITGQEADYQMKIVVPGMEEYQDFLLNKITRIDGVIGVHSSFVLRKPIDTTALPLTYIRRAVGDRDRTPRG